MSGTAPTTGLGAAYDARAGHWRSRLSPSALAAATAATAFRMALAAERGTDPDPNVDELQEGLAAACRWLSRNRNADGGWGDTPESPSNFSATVLAWSALRAAGRCGVAVPLEATGHWLAEACGAPVEPARLAGAVTAAYGADRTFAVPILMMCALNGVLGEGPDAWRWVPQLPCEVAVLPHGLFRHLRLGVVSYALPALIAVGLCRHRALRSRSLPALLRDGLELALLRRLEALQPSHGGFLEAVPLSAFVAMSLCACGRADHPVARKALRFVLDAMRPEDGNWPIDTNLDTWVTSLAVQAFGSREALADGVGAPGAPDAVLDYLLATQQRSTHSYTRACPGGWAWTGLPGAVPDADDTAGALVALSILCPAGHPQEGRVFAAARQGLDWLAGVQNTDGGVPTFCRGWGRLPFDRSAADLTAHSVEAFDAWLPRFPSRESERWRGGRERMVRFLVRTQASEGTWIPLWFGSQARPDGTNPLFGTARVVKSLVPHLGEPGVREAVHAGREFLRGSQHADGSWGQSLHSATGTVEETGLVLCALAADDPACAAGRAWLLEPASAEPPANPIGLYFARLWYSEALYPQIWRTAGLADSVRKP